MLQRNRVLRPENLRPTYMAERNERRLRRAARGTSMARHAAQNPLVIPPRLCTEPETCMHAPTRCIDHVANERILSPIISQSSLPHDGPAARKSALHCTHAPGARCPPRAEQHWLELASLPTPLHPDQGRLRPPNLPSPSDTPFENLNESPCLVSSAGPWTERALALPDRRTAPG